MVLVKDRPKGVQWLGAHRSWGLQGRFHEWYRRRPACWWPVGGSALWPS